MKNLYTFVLTTALIVSALVLPSQTDASIKTAASSAAIVSTFEQPVEDNRVAILEAFLQQYDSPMVGSARTFVEEADKNNLDWKFIVSIAGVESWFGQRIPYNSNNAWGWGVYGDNVINFPSWNDGIKTISKDIRVKYMTKWGATDVYSIGRVYAADPNWAIKVTNFMNRIEAFELSYQQKNLSISI